MGKKRTWRDRRKKGNDPQKPRENEHKEYVKENKYMSAYYAQQLAFTPEEHQLFMNTLQQPLPVCLRVNPTLSNYQTMCNKLSQLHNNLENTVISNDKKKEKMDKLTTVDIEEIRKEFRINSLKLYPRPLVYEISITRMILKKHPALDGAHKFIQKSFDSGLISRQELVSMIPPILLDIQPDHRVLDMCASPGSKTTQLIEHMNEKMSIADTSSTNGFVIANDADYTRAYMLTHQLKRMNSANVIITNQMGQNYPCVYEDLIKTQEGGYDSRFLFDRIMCDVPCTSDGAIRKIPRKWERWKTYDSYVIHPLQLSILNRSFSLTKPGGMLSYSTCSMSPIEDESVVLNFLRKFEGLVELVDCSHLLTGIKYREGMADWAILYENAKEKGKFTQYTSPKDLPKCIKETMFPNKEYALSHNIKRCVRILPHDNNSGGFFIAVFRKLKEFKDKEGKKEPEAAKEEKEIPVEAPAKEETDEIKEIQVSSGDEEESKEVSKLGVLNQNAIQIIPIKPTDPDIEYIVSYYGLDNMPLNRLFATGENYNKILYVSEGVRKFVSCAKGKVNIINMGVTMFVRNKSAFSNTDCIYRISQESVKWLYPYMTKRVFSISKEDAKKLLKEKDMEIKAIVDTQLKSILTAHTTGCIVMKAMVEEDGKQIEEAIVCHKYKERLTVLLSDLQLFNIRVRFGVEE